MFENYKNEIYQFPEAKKNLLKKIFEISPDGPLKGIMVVEIGQHVSGPMVGERLARKGACVIKIEAPKNGDPARHYLSKEIFTSLNASKLSIVIEKGDEPLYQEILLLADVIVDNRSPQAKECDIILNGFLKSADKSRPVIFCSIIGYEGEDNKHLLALDVSVQAATGMASVNGNTSAEPLKVGFVVLDKATAMEASDLIISHLFSLSRGKKIPCQSNHVIFLQVSMANIAAYLMTGQYLSCFMQNKEPVRCGNRDNWLAPFSFYQTQEGMISLAIVNEEQYKRLCFDVLENKNLYYQYPTNESRMKSVDKFQSELENILKNHAATYWLEKCVRCKVPAGKVNTVVEALKQSFAKNFFTHTINRTTVIANPYQSSLFMDNTLHDAPLLNEHRGPIRVLIEKFNSMKKDCKTVGLQQIYDVVFASDKNAAWEMDDDVFTLRGKL